MHKKKILFGNSEPSTISIGQKQKKTSGERNAFFDIATHTNDSEFLKRIKSGDESISESLMKKIIGTPSGVDTMHSSNFIILRLYSFVMVRWWRFV